METIKEKAINRHMAKAGEEFKKELEAKDTEYKEQIQKAKELLYNRAIAFGEVFVFAPHEGDHFHNYISSIEINGNKVNVNKKTLSSSFKIDFIEGKPTLTMEVHGGEGYDQNNS